MSRLLTGGCRCGACRYEAEEPPAAALVCHCSACLKRLGPAMGAMFLKRTSVALSGDRRIYEDVGGSGYSLDIVRCATCATPLALLPDITPEMMLVLARTLDDPSRFKPQFHHWVSGKPDWVAIADDLPQFPQSVDWRQVGGMPEFGFVRPRPAPPA